MSTKDKLEKILTQYAHVECTPDTMSSLWHAVESVHNNLPGEPSEPNVTNINITDGIILDVRTGDVAERKIYVGALGIQQYNEEQCVASGLGEDLPRDWSRTVLGDEPNKS